MMCSDRARRLLAALARGAALVLAVAATLSLATGCTKTSSARAPLQMSLCGGATKAHPPVVTVICNNNSITAHDLRWSGWGSTVATATGWAVVDLCAYEDCAQGDYVTVPIVLITSKPMRCRARADAYSRLQYVFVGRSPFAGLPPDVSPPDGSEKPGDPGNQTVSLAC